METKKTVENDKKIFKNIIELTRSKAQPRIPLMCECFYELSQPQMKGLLSHFCEQELCAKWDNLFDDEAEWIDLWGSIIYFFSGREDISSEPDISEFLIHIKDYIKSDKYKNAKAESAVYVEGEAFGDLLEAL